MRTFLLPALFLALAVIGLQSGTALAGDEATPAAGDEATPSAAYEAKASSLPPPSKEHALAYEGAIVINDTAMGRARFVARAVTEGDRLMWRAEESFSIANGAYSLESVSLLDASLRPISGRVEGREPGEPPFEVEWKRTDSGFEVKRTVKGEGEVEVDIQDVPHKGWSTTSMTALWLFARLTKLEAGTYESVVFDANPDESDAMFEAARWTQGGGGGYRGEKALLLEATKGGKKIVATFALESHDLLEIMLVQESGNKMIIRPVEEGDTVTSEGDGDDLFSRQAQTAKEAALQAALAFATGDVDLVMRVAHWPTIYAAMKAEYDAEQAGDPEADPYPDLEFVKGIMRAQFEESLTKRPKEAIAPMLKGTADALKVTKLPSGDTRVVFPAGFGGVELDVGERDGAWYLVRFPAG